MNRNLRARVILLGLLLAGSISAGFSIGSRSKAPAAAAPSPVEVKSISTMPVEIIEKGKPTQVIQVPIEHQSIPEISVLLMAPLGWLLLLRRQK